MGTEAQKAHRAKAAGVDQMIQQAMSRGRIKSDADLQNFLTSIGQKAEGPWYKRYYSEGPYALYGPSWNPGYTSDFYANEEIPVQTSPDQTWYDPSVAGNWRPTDPLKANRMHGHFTWRDSPEGQAAAAPYGGNHIAAWYALRNQSQYKNAPDMRWFYGADNDAVAQGRAGMGGDSVNMAPGVDYEVGNGQNQNMRAPFNTEYQGRTGPLNTTPGNPLFAGMDKYTNYKYDNVNTAIAPAPGLPAPRIGESKKRNNLLF